MAQLPPDGQWLIQSEDGIVYVVNRFDERTLITFDARDANATALAQEKIANLDFLTREQKSFAHFWSGYFYRSYAH